MITSIPLNKLRLSDRNVRKTNRDEGIESLAEDIASRGLKQNLVVTASKERKGHYEVDAGGRRYLALQRLADAGRIPKNTPIACLVEEWEQAHETSLAENLHRVAMNPADEYEAFATVIADYADGGISDEAERIANCARRFGVSERHVRERLRLAALAPEILAALREGRLTVDAAKAYAVHPDADLQLKVFEREEKKTPASWRHSVQSIRDSMAGKVFLPDHKAVRYLGIEAYREAGGRIEADLFLGSEAGEVLVDTGLVKRLAGEKAQAEADERAKADGWAGATVAPFDARNYYTSPPTPKGFEQEWGGASKLTKKDRGEAVAIFAICSETAELEQRQSYFKPAVKKTARQSEPSYRAPTAEERAAARKAEEVERRAARMAAPKVAGTPLEGKAFWPQEDNWIDAYERDEDEGYVQLALLIRVPIDEVEALLPEAEAAWERDQAELAEEEEAIAAEQAATASSDEDSAASEEPEEVADA